MPVARSTRAMFGTPPTSLATTSSEPPRANTGAYALAYTLAYALASASPTIVISPPDAGIVATRHPSARCTAKAIVRPSRENRGRLKRCVRRPRRAP